MQNFVSLTGYVFSFNDMWNIENACEKRGYAYLYILSPKMQNALTFT
jgi:hypothetical protein